MEKQLPSEAIKTCEWGLFDALTLLTDPVSDYVGILRASDIEDAEPRAIVRVLAALLKEQEKALQRCVEEIEEKLGGRVKLVCACNNQSSVRGGKVLEARIAGANNE